MTQNRPKTLNLPLKSSQNEPVASKNNSNKGMVTPQIEPNSPQSIENKEVKPSQLIILGGGTSVSEGIQKGLFSEIQNKFVIGCNFAHPALIKEIPNFFPPTFITFADPSCFYQRYNNELKNLELIIGRKHEQSLKVKLPNTILIPKMKDKETYNRNADNGFFCPSLTGALALSLGIYLLDVGEIFLLGFDMTGKPASKDGLSTTIINNSVSLQDITNKEISKYIKNSLIINKTINGVQKKFLTKSHWYQEKFTHKGTGKIDFYYSKGKEEKYFGPFKEEVKCKIYNVNLFSRISFFEKISYNKFFGLINNETFNQDTLRIWIREKISKKTN